MSFKTEQTLVHFSAACQVCAARCDARNAQAWAHNHVRAHGHVVELQLAWSVTGPAKP